MKITKLLITTLLTLIFSLSATFAFSVELVKTDPAPITAGEYADITLRFTNNLISGDGNTKEDVSFSIENTQYINLISNHDEKISVVNEGESFTRTFRVYFSEELEQGFIDLPVKISYGNTNLIKDLRVYIESGKNDVDLKISQIITTPRELLRNNDNNKVEILVNNLGEKDAELVSAKLVSLNSEFEESYSFSNQDNLASIPAGSQGVLNFEVDINDIENINLESQLELNYRSKKGISNTYNSFNEVIDFNLSLRSAPYLVVENIVQEDSFELGSNENRLRVTIRNEGTQEAKEVRARVISDVSYPFTIEQSTQYVTANIKPNQSADIIFKYEISEDAEIKDYTSVLVLESLVGQARTSREDFISVTPQYAENIDNFTIGLIVVVLIVIVSLLLGFNTYRSSKKKKSSKKE